MTHLEANIISKPFISPFIPFSIYLFPYCSPYRPSGVRAPNFIVAVDKEQEEKRRLKIVELLRGLFGHVKVSVESYVLDLILFYSI